MSDDPIYPIHRDPAKEIPAGCVLCLECAGTGGEEWEDRNREQFFDKCATCDGNGYVTEGTDK